ncbi:MAG: NAD-dependent dehydratase [Mycobacterium sp.]|nr:NAD-dependent dehydratase [Mycobacterium sp.]
MRILVTGAAGFIGAAVTTDLVAAGHDVVALDALLPSVHGPEPVVSVPRGVPLTVGDVRDAAVLDRVLDGGGDPVDAVCHQAAKVGLGVDLQDAPEYAAHNDLGTATVLAAMDRAGVRRLVLASSMVVYGEGAYACPEHGAVAPGPRRRADLDAGRFEPPCPVCRAPLAPGLVGEDAPLDPRNVYAATKVAQEHLAASWARATEGSVAALRYHNVFGPRMPRDTPYAGVASLFRSALARGEAPRVFEDGGQRRDFVHVSDVARANRLALELGKPPAGLRAYNVGSGVVHTVGDLAAGLAVAAGGPAPVVTGEYRLGDVRHVTASSARAAAELGYRAAVGFGAGVRAFAAEPLRGA